MKRILFAVVLLLGLSMLTTSCFESNDEDDYAQLIIGTWKLEKASYDNEVVSAAELTEGEDYDEIIYSFSKDGYATTSKIPNYKAPYSVKGSTLQVALAVLHIIKLTDKELVLEETILSAIFSDDDDYETMVLYFKKIK